MTTTTEPVISIHQCLEGFDVNTDRLTVANLRELVSLFNNVPDDALITFSEGDTGAGTLNVAAWANETPGSSFVFPCHRHDDLY